MSNKLVIWVILLLVILGGGYFIGKAVKRSMAPVAVTQEKMISPASSDSMTTSPTATSMAESQTIQVEGNEFAFTPSTINATVNKPVTIVFKNTGKYPHNFTITDLSVMTKTIHTGETDTLTFTPTKSGSFEYLCSVPGHADRGMKGTIVVK